MPTIPTLNGPVQWPDPLSPNQRIRQAVTAALKSDAGINSAVSARVFPLIVSQGQPSPSLAVTLESVDRQHCLDGPSGSVLAQVTIAAVSKDLMDSQELAELVRTRFDGFTGTLSGVTVWETLVDDEGDTYTLPPDGTGRPVFVTPVSLTFHYKEPLPSR